MLAARAGGRCSYPECDRELVEHNAGAAGPVVVGEVAHVVGQKRDGPRGEHPMPLSKRDEYDNLIYLCPLHHKLIDKPEEVARHSVAKLLQMKQDHETWVAARLSPRMRHTGVREPEAYVTDLVTSTLLPVQRIPAYVFGAPCSLKPGEVKDKIVRPTSGAALPFILQEKTLYAFCDLTRPVNPFVECIDPKAAARHSAMKWWADDDRMKWYVQLLNRTLNKLTGRLGLWLDKDHHKYYFPPLDDRDLERADPARLPDNFPELDEEVQRDVERFRTTRTRTPSGHRRSRKVAYRPQFKRDGSYKNYWEHLAVGLRFHYLGGTSWVLSVRPGRRFTKDGKRPLSGKGTGRRSTNKASHMYNGDVLAETHFWKEFLSRKHRYSEKERPRIGLDLLGQKLLVDCAPVEVELEWPGVPNDAKPYSYVKTEEDLFSLLDLDRSQDDDSDGDWASTEAWA